MKKILVPLLILFSILLLFRVHKTGHSILPPGNTAGDSSESRPETIYIIGERYHTGIIATAEFLVKYHCVLGEEIPPLHYGDIGWGDRDFYMGRSGGISGALKAVFRSPASVVHLRSFSSFKRWASGSRYVIKINLTEKQAVLLCRFINDSLVVNEGKPEVITKNYISGSAFYRSPLKYGLTNTCNTWVARALEHAGLNISTSMVITVSQLEDRLKPLGTVFYP